MCVRVFVCRMPNATIFLVGECGGVCDVSLLLTANHWPLPKMKYGDSEFEQLDHTSQWQLRLGRRDGELLRTVIVHCAVR